MFAQTLKGMQQFDDDNVKIDMMRHEQARQAKIDAQNDAATALAAKEKAYNMGAEKAVNDTQVRADLGNLMYQKGLTNPEQAMLVNQSDSQINATNAGAKVSDALAGIDRTKLNADQQKRYDQLASADGSLNTTSADGKDTYNVATKLGLLKDAYALGGIGETDAYNKAAKTLGISNDSEQGVIKSNNEGNAFVDRYTNLATIDPLFGQTKLDKLADYKAEWVKLHPEDKDFMTSAVNGLQSSLNSANGVAIAERKKELDELLAKKAALGDNVKNADLDNAIKMAQLRITASGHEASSENGLAKAIAGLSSGGSNLSREDKFSINLADQLRQYATNSKSEVGQNIIEAYRQAKEKGYSAAETRALVQGGIHADGIPEKNQGQAYKFDNQSMFDKGPSKAYTDSNDYVALRQQQIATNDAQKEAEFAQLQKLFAAKGGSSGLAALDKQIYDVQRTPQEAYTQAAMQAGKDFAYDEDLAGHKGIADAQAIADQAAMNKFHADAVGGTKPSAVAPTTGITPATTAVVKPNAFQMPAGYNDLDDAGRKLALQNSGVNLIKQEEHNGGPGGRYVPYDDISHDKNGNEVNTGKALGYGIHLNEFLAATPQLKGNFDPKNKDDQKLFDAYENKRLGDNITVANSQAVALGLPAEAIPVLASMNHQSGTGWMSNWPNMVKQLKAGDYDGAIATVDKSLWHQKQTPERAQKFMDMLGAVRDMKASGLKWNQSPDAKYNSSLDTDTDNHTSILQKQLADLNTKREAVLSERSANPWYNIPTTLAISKQADAIGAQMSGIKTDILNENNSKLLKNKLLEIEQSKDSSEASTAAGKSKTNRLKEQAKLLQEKALLYSNDNTNRLDLYNQ
jgi:hypothetical protein